jgi:hypothetical protein
MTVRTVAITLGLGCAMRLCASEPQTRVKWTFDGEGAKPWTQRVNHCKDVHLEKGVLKGVTSGADPFLTSPAFSLSAKAGQVVEFRAKYPVGGHGELFWIPVGANGPQQKWSASFEWIGDGEWHDYRVRPFWQGEKQIGTVRIDFVNGRSDVPFEVAWVRIVEESGMIHAGEPVWSGASLAEWSASEGGEVRVKDEGLVYRPAAKGGGALESPALSINADEAFVLAVEMSAQSGEAGTVAWACDRVSGLHKKTFKVKADGRCHTYNIDLGSEKTWAGKIELLRLTPVDGKSGRAQIRSIRVSDDLQGPADVSVAQARLADAINRVGRPVSLLVQFINCGGSDATNVTLAVKKLPKGVRVASAPGWERVAAVPASGIVTHTLALAADKAVSGTAEFVLSGDGTDGQRVQAQIEILPGLNLPKASYVPEPKPVKSDYEIGALYFPGWSKIEAWSRIWPVAPERKPVLGWYDEANPEVVDWQIKWAVENGLSYFLVDWYWHKGDQHHDHWVKAFRQAHYKSYLKWAVMWANHNAAGSHSEADQRAVTKFWIENYFNTPEYYRIDDQPVVMIWSPQNMERDLGAGGCKRLLDLSRQMAREAGYKGIYFIAMKWPEASWEPKVVQGYEDMGFDMTSIYHYMGNGGKAENPRRFSFDLVADSNRALWEGLQQTGILPFLPNLSTGWDDRPWHGDKGTEVYGRTVKDFRRICRDAKKFADETGIKRLTLAPLNEWGEGSYAEPCAQFGFGMYESVRDTFCRKPEAGWPVNCGPQDVGLGPYDLPIPPPDSTSDWTFAATAQGWAAMMGISEFKAGNGLTFKTVSRDPALERAIPSMPAKKIRQVVVRMKVPGTTGGVCQLFWSSGGTPTEGTSLSLPLAADGQVHDYVFEVGQSRVWRGRIGRLRFDPCNASGVDVAVSRIRLVGP